MIYTYICSECGCRYQSAAKVEAFNQCRNRGCKGKLVRK